MERFDTLFGARRFEFGPTGTYGALARSNLSSPGVGLEFSPSDRIYGFAGYRAAFLASSRDFWTTAGVWDPSGASGTGIGHQVEAKLQYSHPPGNLRFEAGGAVLLEGELLRNAPNSAGEGDPLYLYTQVSLTF